MSMRLIPRTSTVFSWFQRRATRLLLQQNTSRGSKTPEELSDERYIHPSAVIGENVTLGRGTSIGPHAVLGDGVAVGCEVKIFANATLYSGTILGDRVVVQAGAVLGSAGFGYARNHANGEYVLLSATGQAGDRE